MAVILDCEEEQELCCFENTKCTETETELSEWHTLIHWTSL